MTDERRTIILDGGTEMSVPLDCMRDGCNERAKWRLTIRMYARSDKAGAYPLPAESTIVTCDAHKQHAIDDGPMLFKAVLRDEVSNIIRAAGKEQPDWSRTVFSMIALPD